MGAILAENKIHHLYWRSTSKPTITTGTGTVATGFEFENLFDNNAHTSFMNATGTQTVTVIDFGADNFTFNGFAVYGHNLTTTQGIKVEHSDDNASYTNFTDSAVYPANAEHLPVNNNGEAFCVYLKGAAVTKSYIRITTVNWTTSTFLSNLAVGEFVEGIDISAPYSPPNFTLQEVAMKRNNEGNFLSSDTRKIPQKLNIRLTALQESDLSAASGVTTSINGLSANHSFIDYFGFFLSRFPFFVIHDDGGSGTNSEKFTDRNQVYFCTIDKSLKQPQFNTSTTLNWSINAIGYLS